MKHYCDHWILEWCHEHGWTDLFQERVNHYWAFPPGAVMPEPIPSRVLREIKSCRGWSPEERIAIAIGWGVTVLSFVGIGVTRSPLPLMFAFVSGAIISALLEVEE